MTDEMAQVLIATLAETNKDHAESHAHYKMIEGLLREFLRRLTEMEQRQKMIIDLLMEKAT